jgi:hypothetical protein
MESDTQFDSPPSVVRETITAQETAYRMQFTDRTIQRKVESGKLDGYFEKGKLRIFVDSIKRHEQELEDIKDAAARNKSFSEGDTTVSEPSPEERPTIDPPAREERPTDDRYVASLENRVEELKEENKELQPYKEQALTFKAKFEASEMIAEKLERYAFRQLGDGGVIPEPPRQPEPRPATMKDDVPSNPTTDERPSENPPSGESVDQVPAEENMDEEIKETSHTGGTSVA